MAERSRSGTVRPRVPGMSMHMAVAVACHTLAPTMPARHACTLHPPAGVRRCSPTDGVEPSRDGVHASTPQAQYSSEGAAASGLRQLLIDTAPKTVVCVDTDPWLGMQAAGGISTGQNGMGRALMATRSRLMEAKSTG